MSHDYVPQKIKGAGVQEFATGVWTLTVANLLERMTEAPKAGRHSQGKVPRYAPASMSGQFASNIPTEEGTASHYLIYCNSTASSKFQCSNVLMFQPDMV